MSESISSCWVMTEGMAGTENQCLGVAEALGVTPVVKRVKLRFPWKQLTPWLCVGQSRSLAPESDAVTPPWPDLLLASGRKSIGLAMDIRKKSGGATFVVQIQDPRVNPRHFDMVVVPQHDPTRGDNVMVVKGALNRLTPQKLDAARLTWKETLEKLPAPRVAVVIGGNSKAHALTPGIAQRLAASLQGLSAQGFGLMVTASRRTGAENEKVLRAALQGDNIHFWDGTGDNPYFGYLAHADYIIVTEDSVSMVCDALGTGKPVYIAPLEGGAKRLDLFHSQLMAQGYTRRFEGVLESWTYPPLHEAAAVAAEIEKRMAQRCQK